jgi:hypothetical protein
LYDGVSNKNIPENLPPNFENKFDIKNSLPILRESFVIKNKYLPNPSFDDKKINVCCHIRLGDALGTRILDNQNIFNVIKEFQKHDVYRITIHSDGDIKDLINNNYNNIFFYNNKTDVLQVLSDFINADILMINYSSLSIAAHLLADKNQQVIYPNKIENYFSDRILEKCVTCHDFLSIMN